MIIHSYRQDSSPMIILDDSFFQVMRLSPAMFIYLRIVILVFVIFRLELLLHMER